MALRFIKSIWQSNYISLVRTRVMTTINTVAEQLLGLRPLLKEGIDISFTSLVELIAVIILLTILLVILSIILIFGLAISLADLVMRIINSGQKIRST